MEKIHELFHSLANKHNFISVVSGVTRQTLEECLKENLSENTKGTLSSIVEDLKKIELGVQEANDIVLRIKEKVYNNKK